MRYTLSNTINKPLDVVAAKFTEPDSAMHWMEGLERSEHLSGRDRQAQKPTFTLYIKERK